MDRLRWGILGAANIARLRIIPAFGPPVANSSPSLRVTEPRARRSPVKRHPPPALFVRRVARRSSIDVVYIPLPKPSPCGMM
jgi:predicted dehydrogenase